MDAAGKILCPNPVQHAELNSWIKGMKIWVQIFIPLNHEFTMHVNNNKDPSRHNSSSGGEL
jgi:hypothetical protein